jgi:pyruvate dehydrogenase E1 component alpha subunit/2-oxoisovalerate dehydrogenase E1 component alpha subunit
MISHLGTMISYVTGMLLARRLQGRLGTSVGAASIGDGGTSTGAFHEGLNLAAVERLPLVIALANNQYAYSTPNDRQFACTNLVDRAKGYGVEGYEVDATDLEDCMRVFEKAVKRAREGHGPQLVVGSMLRLAGHGEHDDASYIPAEVRQQGRDCLLLAEQSLRKNGRLDDAAFKALQSDVLKEIEEAVSIANSEALPDPYKESWRSLASAALVDDDPNR